MARSSIRCFQSVVHDYAEEPRRERAIGIELLDPLPAPQERITHDVLRQLTITHDEVRSAGGLELMALHKHFKPTDVSTPESVDSPAFIGEQSVVGRHGTTIRQTRERFGYGGVIVGIS
jgi:hypothetical protein